MHLKYLKDPITFVHLRQKVCKQEIYLGLSVLSLKVVVTDAQQDDKSFVCSFNEVAITNANDYNGSKSDTFYFKTAFY